MGLHWTMGLHRTINRDNKPGIELEVQAMR